MTTDSTPPVQARTGTSSWTTRAIWLAVGVVVLIVAYFVLAAFLPRWWSFRVEDLSQRSFARGIGWGLLFGVVCTLVPLLLFWSAVVTRGKKAGKFTSIAAVVLAVVVAVPNLLTLTIVLGTSNAAHAGERTLDTEAPGFRGATATGAVVAVIAFVLIAVVLLRARRRRIARRTATQQ